MENINYERELVGVLFPGVVKNDDKALACLGGIRSISNVYSNLSKKRLGLTFQPDNPCVRKLYANTNKCAGVLLKVKVKKTKIGNEIKREVISTVNVGTVKTMFKFDSICDFQYLPVYRESSTDSSMKCVLEHVLPTGLDSPNFMLEPAPLFLIPQSFSRFERAIKYTYTEKRYVGEASQNEAMEGPSVHSKLRSLRGHQATPFDFNLTDDLPSEPHESIVKAKVLREKLVPSLTEEYQIIEKHFQDRPIWSLNLLKFYTNIRIPSLKYIMPCLAVYHKTGPWRRMWVRYGYDPRKEPGSRIYQTLDFRLRQGQGIRTLIVPRNNDCPRNSEQTRSYKRNLDTSESDISEANVIFKPDTVPTQKNIFYQFCDIQIPEVKEMLATPPPPGYLCHERRGWLSVAADEHARDHMFRYVKQTLLSTNSADLSKLEAGSDSEDSNSDEEARTSEFDNTEEQIDDT